MTGDGGSHSFSPPFLSLRRSTFDGGLGKHPSSAGSKRWGEQQHPRLKKALEETGVSFFSLCSALQRDKPLYGTLDNSMRYSFYKRFEELTEEHRTLLWRRLSSSALDSSSFSADYQIESVEKKSSWQDVGSQQQPTTHST